ncbi:hypothetical protein PG990_004309 [Apiospora arundinis]
MADKNTQADANGSARGRFQDRKHTNRSNYAGCGVIDFVPHVQPELSMVSALPIGYPYHFIPLVAFIHHSSHSGCNWRQELSGKDLYSFTEFYVFDVYDGGGDLSELGSSRRQVDFKGPCHCYCWQRSKVLPHAGMCLGSAHKGFWEVRESTAGLQDPRQGSQPQFPLDQVPRGGFEVCNESQEVITMFRAGSSSVPFGDAHDKNGMTILRFLEAIDEEELPNKAAAF